MPSDIRYSFFLADDRHPAAPNLKVWNESVPVNRRSDGAAGAVRYGDFFTAVRNFLEQHPDVMTDVLSKLPHAASADDIREFRIYLEKHGEFYHPCRLGVLTNSGAIIPPLVLNCAISDIGKRFIHHEFEILNRLFNEFHTDVIPRVYAKGTAATPEGIDIPIFIGDWFSGYHEFHLSQNDSADQDVIRVWDPDNPARYLTKEETADVYRQASRILTELYHLETGEQVCLWHHAAGDFVVQCRDHPPDVKLITVRHYASLTDNDSADRDAVLGGLLLFLTDMSIRMRIDRSDGVGDLAWSGDAAVQGTVKGFSEAMAGKSLPQILPDTVPHAFGQFISTLPENGIFQLAEAVADSYSPQAPEVPLIRRHLADHVKSLHQHLRRAVLSQSL